MGNQWLLFNTVYWIIIYCHSHLLHWPTCRFIFVVHTALYFPSMISHKVIICVIFSLTKWTGLHKLFVWHKLQCQHDFIRATVVQDHPSQRKWMCWFADDSKRHQKTSSNFYLPSLQLDVSSPQEVRISDWGSAPHCNHQKPIFPLAHRAETYVSSSTDSLGSILP